MEVGVGATVLGVTEKVEYGEGFGIKGNTCWMGCDYTAALYQL